MTEPGKSPALSKKTLAFYASMLLVALGIFLLVRAQGETLIAPATEALQGPAKQAAPPHLLMHILLALVVVIAVSRALGAVFRRLRQPPVIGEVVAGILLGPSFVGLIAPSVQQFLVPNSIAPHLGIVAQVGVIVFMFVVGLELNTSFLRQRPESTLAISHASIVLPFLLGSTVALWLYPRLSSASVGFTNFSLFMGVSMSVTAFPVLARILSDRGTQNSRLGSIALACAAVDDASAWCLLAAVVGIVRSQGASAITTLGLTLAYVAFMWLVVRPVAIRYAAREEREGRLRQRAIVVALVGILVSALITEAIGIHALFGAFLLGAVIPNDSLLARELTRRVQDFVVILLLPAFFAFTGMRTQIGLLSSAQDLLYCGVIIVVASLGKFGGAALAARLTGMGLRDSFALGILMNTRGLMELIVLNVGLDLGVLSPRLFAMLVIMAVVTTLATAPLLDWLLRGAQAPEPPSALSSPTNRAPGFE